MKYGLLYSCILIKPLFTFTIHNVLLSIFCDHATYFKLNVNTHFGLYSCDIVKYLRHCEILETLWNIWAIVKYLRYCENLLETLWNTWDLVKYLRHCEILETLWNTWGTVGISYGIVCHVVIFFFRNIGFLSLHIDEFWECIF